MKNRARIVLGLAALAAFFLVPIAEASLTRASEPAVESPPPTLTSLQTEPSEFSLFAGDELTRAAADASSGETFHPLAAVSLLSKGGAEGSLVSADEPSYPKTRVWAIDVLGSTLVSRSSELSLESHWACGDFSCGLASGGRKDPLGLITWSYDNPYRPSEPLAETIVATEDTASSWRPTTPSLEAPNPCAPYPPPCMSAAGPRVPSSSNDWTIRPLYELPTREERLAWEIETIINIASLKGPRGGSGPTARARRAKAFQGGRTPAKTGETVDTAVGRTAHSAFEAERAAEEAWDVLNRTMRDTAGEPIRVPRRVDLESGAPVVQRGTQTVRPDAVSFTYEVVLDDKPLTRAIVKDKQEIIRNIEAYRARTGSLPKRVAIQRYDPVTGKPVQTDLYSPEYFLPKPKE